MKKYLAYFFYCLAFLSIPVAFFFKSLWVSMLIFVFSVGMGDYFHPNKNKKKASKAVLAGLYIVCIVAVMVVVLLATGII